MSLVHFDTSLLTEPQRRVWSAARRYAELEVAYSNAEESHRSLPTLESQHNLGVYYSRRSRAARRLLGLVAELV